MERWHQTLKNRILLEHDYLPGDLERQIAAFVAYCSHARTTKAWPTSLRPTSTSGGLRPSSSNEKDQAPDNRKPSLAASTACRKISITDDPEPPFGKPPICLKSSDDGPKPNDTGEGEKPGHRNGIGRAR